MKILGIRTEGGRIIVWPPGAPIVKGDPLQPELIELGEVMIPGWKVHTPAMLAEISRNPQCAVMTQPLRIFANLLEKVAERAIEIDDPALNILMMRLTLYDQADPEKHSFEEIAEAYDKQERRRGAPKG